MEVAVKYDVRETPINTTTQEYIHDFCKMATKITNIEFQLLRTNQLLQAILTEQYINMD